MTLIFRTNVIRRLTIGLLLVIFGLTMTISVPFNIPVAGASGWNQNSQGDCSPGYPRAASWLNWWDEASTASGTYRGQLYYLYNGNWVKESSGETTQTGSTKNAQVNNSHSYLIGVWDETGGVLSSNFGASGTSDSGNWTC